MSKKIFASITTITCSMMMLFGSFVPVAQADDLGSQLSDLMDTLDALCNSYYDATGEVLSGCGDYIDTATPLTPSTGNDYEGIPDSFTFENNLKYGMSNDEVKYLQIILKEEVGAPTYPDTVGATGWFGPITKSSAIEFQEMYATTVLAPWGLTNGTGFVGQTTREKLNELLASSASTPTPTPPTDEPSDYDNEGDCLDADYYWYEDACHANEQPADEFDNEGDCLDAGYYWYDDECHEDAEVAEGELTVELSDDNPASGTLVQGQATADLAHYTFINEGSSDVEVTEVTLDRIGVSADATLSNVYLFDGPIRLTSAASVSSGSVDFNDASGIFTVPADSSKIISVKSSIAGSSAGQTVGVSLASVTADDAIVSGDFSIAGNLHSIASATLAGVAVGTPLPSSAATTDPQSDVRVWESTFTITNRNVDFTRLALRQINSIESDDIENFRLLVDGVEVASVDSLDDDGYVTFDFDTELQTGNRNIRVLADVIGGSGRIIQMSLRNTADLDVSDSQYGVNVLATGTFAASTANLSVNAGTMTVEKSSDSPTGNIVNAAGDAVLGEWIFTARGESIKVETLLVDFAHLTSTSSDETSTLRNGRVMVDGVQAGSTKTIDPSSTGTSFTTNFTVEPGSPAIVQVRADVYDNDGSNACSSGDKITATLSQGNANASKLTSLGTVNVPSSSTNANQLTLAAGSMTLAKKTNYTNQTIQVPQTGFKLGEWTLTGGTSEAVNVHTFSLDIDNVSGTSLDYDDLSNIYLVYGSNTSNIKTTPTAADNDWSVSFNLAKNEVMNVALYGNIGSSVSTSTDSLKTDLTVTGTGADSGATVTSADKDGQTIIYGESSITATRDASTLDASIVYDNQTVPTAAYKFEAKYDSYDITELVFTISDATNVENVILKNGDSVLKTLPGAATSTFSGLSVPVAANSSEVLTVYTELGTVGSGAGTTGAAITTDYYSGEAIPDSTGVQASISDSTSPGNAVYVYASTPSISKGTGHDSILNNGLKTVLEFNIASNGGSVSWDRLYFGITKSAGPILATSTTYLYDGSTLIDGVFSGTNLASTTDAATLIFAPTSEQQISGEKKYQLKTNFSGITANTQYVTITVGSDSDYSNSTTSAAIATGDADTSLIWSDVSALSHSTSTVDWTDAYKVQSLPITHTLNATGF
jgi:hypothetical protein